MSARHIGAALGLALLLVGVPRPSAAAQVRIDVQVDLFRDRLTPYGTWITCRYGRGWVPRGMPMGWRPYTVGYWAYSDAGWIWVSDEPFGWATYHYGRWYRDPVQGWVWVPDTEWGPGWVAWRSSDLYVGWAPLPPGISIVYDDVFDLAIDPVAFTFIRIQYFSGPDMRRYYEPASRRSRDMQGTANVTRYTGRGSRVFNQGVGVDVVERALRHPLPRLTVQSAAEPGPSRVEQNRVLVYRPTPGGRETPPASVGRPTGPGRGAAPPDDRGRTTGSGSGRDTKAPPNDRSRGTGPARGTTPPTDRGRAAEPKRGQTPPPNDGRGQQQPDSGGGSHP